MKEDELIARINFLYNKSKNIGLTDEEKNEQSKLRSEYRNRVKRNLRAQLDNIDFDDK